MIIDNSPFLDSIYTMSFYRFLKLVLFLLTGFLVFRVAAPLLIATSSTWLAILSFVLMGTYALYSCWILMKFLNRNSKERIFESEVVEGDFEVVDSED